MIKAEFEKAIEPLDSIVGFYPLQYPGLNIYKCLFFFDSDFDEKQPFSGQILNSMLTYYRNCKAPSIEERIKMSRGAGLNAPGRRYFPWVDCVVGLGQGVVMSDLWSVVGSDGKQQDCLVAKGAGAAAGGTIAAFGVLERELLWSLIHGRDSTHQRFMSPNQAADRRYLGIGLESIENLFVLPDEQEIDGVGRLAPEVVQGIKNKRLR